MRSKLLITLPALMLVACSPTRPATQHRADDTQCQAPRGPGNCSAPSSLVDGGAQFQCGTDSDCTAGTNGRCGNGGGPAGCWCSYDECATDSDCPAGKTCACHGSPYTYGAGNVCVPGNCRVDSDCGSGGSCSPSAQTLCGDAGSYCLGYYCHTPSDECVNDADCASGLTCVYSATAAHWTCVFYAEPI